MLFTRLSHLLPVDVCANYVSFSVDCIVYLSAWLGFLKTKSILSF